MEKSIITIQQECFGCGLVMPYSLAAHYDGYYNCSAECWSLFTEVLGYEYGHVVAFRQVHTMTVDTYAVQHAGGRHKAKSVAIHLAGLFATHELGFRGVQVTGLMQRLANHYTNFPTFKPPLPAENLTIFDVALATEQLDHIDRVKAWSAEVWSTWSIHHDGIARWLAAVLPQKGFRASA